jgi:spore germination protein KB
MNNGTVSTKQFVAILAMFMLGTAVILSGNGPAKQDSWISLLIAMAISSLNFFVYARLIHLHPGRCLFDMATDLFGAWLGKAVVALYVWYCMHLGALVLRSFNDFIQVVAMPETPAFPILALMGLLSVYAVASGTETFGKCCELLLFLLVLLVIITTSLLAKSMDPKNLLPMGAQGSKVILGNAYSLYIFPFAESAIFMCMAQSLGSGSNPYKAYYGALALSGALFLTATLRNIMVIGYPLLQTFYYPSYGVMQIVSIGDFLTRIEGTISSIFIMAGFVKISVCFFSASRGVVKLFGIDDHKQVIFPVFLLIVALSRITYHNAIELFEAFDIYKYYTVPFLLVIPAAMLATAELKRLLKAARAAPKDGS